LPAVGRLELAPTAAVVAVLKRTPSAHASARNSGGISFAMDLKKAAGWLVGRRHRACDGRAGARRSGVWRT